MRNIETNLVGQEFAFAEVDDVLHELGFIRGGKWDYHYATYDYPLALTKLDESVYLRIETRPVEGRIEEDNCVVKIDQVCIIGGLYQHGVQDTVKVDRAMLNRSRELLEKFAALYQFPVEISMETAEKHEEKQQAEMLPTA